MRIDPLSVHPRKKGENSRPYAWIVRIVKRMMSLFSLLTAENSNDSHNQFSSVQRTTTKKKENKEEWGFHVEKYGFCSSASGKKYLLQTNKHGWRLSRVCLFCQRHHAHARAHSHPCAIEKKKEKRGWRRSAETASTPLLSECLLRYEELLSLSVVEPTEEGFVASATLRLSA